MFLNGLIITIGFQNEENCLLFMKNKDNKIDDFSHYLDFYT